MDLKIRNVYKKVFAISFTASSKLPKLVLLQTQRYHLYPIVIYNMKCMSNWILLILYLFLLLLLWMFCGVRALLLSCCFLFWLRLNYFYYYYNYSYNKIRRNTFGKKCINDFKCSNWSARKNSYFLSKTLW